MEAHKEFASMLTRYRQVAVMKVVTPSVHITPDDDLYVWMDLVSSFDTEKDGASDHDTNDVEIWSLKEYPETPEASQSSNTQHK